MVLGSPGGSKIITSVLQTLIRRYDFGWSLEEAIERPRWHHQWLPDYVQLEPNALTDELCQKLEDRGHQLKVADSLFGNVTAIARENGLWVGVADGRRGGSAMGF
jgi:gamma-glutamyltranspeptidase/glutathione hydrolase